MPTTVAQVQELMAALEGRPLRRVRLGDFEAEFGDPPPGPLSEDRKKATGLNEIVAGLKKARTTIYEDPHLYSDAPIPPPGTVPGFAHESESEETSD